MGLTCGCADPSQFMREFGVDIDSRDSMDILKAAEEVTEEEIQDVKREFELSHIFRRCHRMTVARSVQSDCI